MTTFNTGETDLDLKQEYNPEGSTLRKAQLRMLDMLEYLQGVFEKLNVPWHLDAGSVLGAVRHGGFIPWDDDLDVVILDNDAVKVKKYLITHPHPQYKIQCKETDPNFFERWMVLRDTKSEYVIDSPMHNCRKYRGIQVDIFVERTGVVESIFKFSKKISGLNNYHLAGRVKGIPHIIHFAQTYFFHPLFSFISLLCGNKKIVSYNYGIQWNFRYAFDDVYPTKPMLFEGKYFPGPANPENYLVVHYGKNWQFLPPKDKRNWHQATLKIWE